MPKICPKTGKRVKPDLLIPNDPECILCEHFSGTRQACAFPKTRLDLVREGLSET